MIYVNQTPEKYSIIDYAQRYLKSNLSEKIQRVCLFSQSSQLENQDVILLYKSNKLPGSYQNSQEIPCLRGGGCGTSKQQRVISPSQEIINMSKTPEYFMRDLKRHLNILIDKANVTYDEKEKEQILISIQWFIAMQEHFNTLCKDSESAAATYDLLFESFPKLLKSAVTYLRISGFLCLQILQISNDIARVLFTFYMTNDKRIMKIQDKEMLEELIIDFETQLDIEAQNIWVAGAEFEITMIKAVVQSSPSNSDEGKKLLVSFMGGLVKSFLTMSPSEDLIDTLINGAKFLYKAYQINNLKKKYEIDYYFLSLKWQIIQLIKQDMPTQNIIKYLIHAYKNYIENSNDWLLNFCWIRLISSILTYRPIISKSEISEISEQSKIWNSIVQQKYLHPFQFNKCIGRLQLISLQNQNQLAFGILQKFKLKSLNSFYESLIKNLLPNKLFSFGDISIDVVERDYSTILFEKISDSEEYTQQQKNIFSEIIKYIERCKNNFLILSQSNIETKQNPIDREIIIQDVQMIKKLSQFFIILTLAICNIKQLSVLKCNMIVESMVPNSDYDKNELSQEIKDMESQFFKSNNKPELIYNQTKVNQNLISLEMILEENSKSAKIDINSFMPLVENILAIITQIKQISEEYIKMKGSLEHKVNEGKKLNQQKDNKLKMNQICKFRLINPLHYLEKTIQNILNLSYLEHKISNIFKFFQNSPNDDTIYALTLKYELEDIISSAMDFKETLSKINQFLIKNISSLQMFQFQIKSQVNNEQDVVEMLKKQLKMILQFFFEEERRSIDPFQSNSVSLNQILHILKQDFDRLEEVQIENLDLITIRQAMAFVEQFLEQFELQKLNLIKEQIVQIYDSINVKIDQGINQLPKFQLENKKTSAYPEEIELYLLKITHLNHKIDQALKICQSIQKTLSDKINYKKIF